VYRNQTSTSGTTALVPLTGAIIKVNGRTMTSTDSQGRYIVKDLPPGSYTVLAALRNYGFTQASLSLPRASGQPGAPNAIVDFPAQSVPSTFYTLSGRAVSPSGAPVQGVFIYMTGVPNPVASTNSYGNYVIRDRAFGTYSLTASGGGFNWRPDPTSISIPRAAGTDPKAPTARSTSSAALSTKRRPAFRFPPPPTASPAAPAASPRPAPPPTRPASRSSISG
jgi:hypothetical protein